MPGQTGWKVLRTTTDLSDDADFVGTLAAPAAGALQRVHNLIPSNTDEVSGVALQLQWLDSAGDQVAGRGTFDLSVVQLADVVRLDGTVLEADGMLGDSVTLTGQVGYRIITLDDLRGSSQISVRLTNLAGPGGTEDHCRVLYREL
jgi:hypothetical protein